MDLCLLCLKGNTNEFEAIEINSTQWESLNITNILEKHFWQLSTIQSDCWICLECWQKVDDFHNFYASIEEAHMNLEQIKIEEQLESTSSASKILVDEKYEDECMESEILLIENVEDDKEQIILHDNEELITEDFVVEKEEAQTDNDDELNLYNNSIEELEETQNDTIELQITSDKPLENVNIKDDTNEFIAEITVSTETETENLQDIDIRQNSKIIEFSSDDNDSSRDSNYEAVKNDKPRRNKNTKWKDDMESKSVKEKDEFIAKEYGQLHCDLCNMPVDNFVDLNKHFLEVHNKKPYIKCCSYRFQNRCVLYDHLLMHLNPEYFKCKECGRVLASRNNLKVHTQQVHPPKDKEYNYKCDDCGKTFPMNYLLRKHKLKHIGTVGQFPCKECGKIYRAEHLLKNHFDIVHLKKCAKVCDVCGKTCDTSNDLKVHKIQHEPQIPVNCEVCGLRLSNNRNYLIHKKQRHPEGGQQEHPCHICNKIYPSRRSLTRHVTNCHKKGYDHKCEVCGKAFKLSKRLKEHMTIHTGEILYTCSFCPKTFNSKANMNQHSRNHHPKQWAEYKYKLYYGTDIPKANDV